MFLWQPAQTPGEVEEVEDTEEDMEEEEEGEEEEEEVAVVVVVVGAGWWPGSSVGVATPCILPFGVDGARDPPEMDAPFPSAAPPPLPPLR